MKKWIALWSALLMMISILPVMPVSAEEVSALEQAKLCIDTILTAAPAPEDYTFSEELAEKATSMAMEFSQEFDRKILISSVLEKFYEYYDGFLHTGDLSYLQETYNQMLVNRDTEVVIHEPGNEYCAKALGINAQGELLVERKDGRKQNIYAGEVSVRGVYGYV